MAGGPAVTLRRIDRGTHKNVVELGAGSHDLGRSALFNIGDRACSRQQLVLTVSEGETVARVHQPSRKNASFLRRGDSVQKIAPETDYEVKDGVRSLQRCARPLAPL